jgi:hypothetical protein
MKPPSPLFTRRRFLHGMTAAAGVAVVGTSRLGLSSLHAATASSAAYTLWAMEAKKVTETFPDGSVVDFFRYLPLQGSDTRGTLPFFEETEGATIVVAVKNSLAVAIRPEIPGVASGPMIAPGATDWFRFTMPAAGTYVLGQANYRELSGPLGLAGVMVSRPSSGAQELWNGGPAFDREYILHYQDSDDRWNSAAAAGNLPNQAVYEPNFFTLNGLSYPNTSADADSHIACLLGERVLLRLSNSGRMRQSIHFHGYHVEIAARGNVPNTMLPPKDTVELSPSGGTTDLILTVNQVGTYPVHPHSLTAVTSNGLYPYGQLTLIEAI